HAAALWTVWLRDDQLQLISRGGQALERGHGELGRAAEDQLHSHSPARTSFLILRLIRSRLRALTWLMKRRPLRWSISWQNARARRSSPDFSNQFPSTSWARTVT